MRHLTIIWLIAALAAPIGAHAACYADYKAKRGTPLQLHYGVIELPDTACGSKTAAAKDIKRRLSDAGWELLSVVSLFEEDGLASREDAAGENFLAY